ncbi:MAG: hypothetical protein HFE86_06375 [Clostridiales bacterium]|nr:hypothetical protein [Clostridiales bacterium]
MKRHELYYIINLFFVNTEIRACKQVFALTSLLVKWYSYNVFVLFKCTDKRRYMLHGKKAVALGRDTILDKIRAYLLNAFQKTARALHQVWDIIKKMALQAIRYIGRFYRNIPVSNRIKISVLLAFGILLLIIIALLCVPGKGETAPEDASLQSRYKDGVIPSNLSGLGSGLGSAGDVDSSSKDSTGGFGYDTLSGWPTRDALDPNMSVPSVGQPAGGKAGYTPTTRERANWEQLLIYLERCRDFQFADEDKESKLAVGAARMAVELYDYADVNADQTEFWIDEDTFQNYYYLLSGQCMRGMKMDRIQWENGKYHYTQPDFVSRNAAAEITSVYLLEGGFYRVEGIVTRGRADEAGCYSRKVTMLLLAAPLLYNHFYVLSMENVQTPYTSLYDLRPSSSSNAPTSREPAPSSGTSSNSSAAAASSSSVMADSTSSETTSVPASSAGKSPASGNADTRKSSTSDS